MTSDKPSRSQASELLDYALGEKRVALKELSPQEFDQLLNHTLGEVDLRELRGFQRLEKLLERSPGSWVFGQRTNPLDVVRMSSDTKVQEVNPDDQPVNLKTHMVRVSRGSIEQHTFFRRHESGEVSDDRKVIENWGVNGGYPWRVGETILVLRRPNNHSTAHFNLFLVKYVYEKVLHQDQMSIATIEVVMVPVEMFRTIFAENYATVGVYLIWELKNLANQTLHDLEHQVGYFRRSVEKLERLSNSITDL